MIEFPKSIVVELPADSLITPFGGNLPPSLIATVLNLNFRGVAKPEGTWLIEPHPSWKLERLDVGKYQVTHNLGYTNTALSVSLVEQPGIIDVLSHSPTEFTLQVLVERQPEDATWLFVLARVLSSPARP